MKKKLIIDKISTEKHILGSAKINQIWNFLKTVKIRIPILYHQIELKCKISYQKVEAAPLLNVLTPKRASEYHLKSLRQRVEFNFLNEKPCTFGVRMLSVWIMVLQTKSRVAEKFVKNSPVLSQNCNVHNSG